MTNAEQGDGGLPSVIGSRVRRNKRVAIGAAGLAAVLSVGALLLIDQATEKSGTTARLADDTGPAARTSAPPSHSAVAGKATAAPIGPVATAASGAPGAKTVGERLSEARSANKRLGTEVRRPAPRTASTVDASKVKVVQTGTNQSGHMIRVSSAPLDLTGYRELAWVRGGVRYGDATCTQKITVSENVPPKERSTLLICWRTTAKKSAYTVAVDFTKRPSMADSVAALDEAWTAMR